MKVKRLIFFLIFSTMAHLLQGKELKVYFSYAPEMLHTLNQESSLLSINPDQLKKWDDVATRAAEEKKLTFYEHTRMFTYLYEAQKEAAFLSYNAKGAYSGSLDPISYQVLTFFFSTLTKPIWYEEDLYSQKLANIVFEKIKQRIEKENSLPFVYKASSQNKDAFSAGVDVAKWIPWYAKPSIAYWPDPPPPMSDPIWKKEIQEIKQAQTPMTQAKKEAIYLWAGLAYRWSDDWRSRVNEFLSCRHTPLLKTLHVRSTVMTGLYDCIDAYVGCKYHYQVIRPQVYDPTIKYIIPVPKHPSYPAGHAAESSVVAAIMSFFFPSDSSYWNSLAEQCGLSRIWGGIHYPIDIQSGKYCGATVAKKVIASSSEEIQK